MSRARPRVRTLVESAVAAAVGFALVALVVVLLRDAGGPERAHVADGAQSVDDVVALGSGDHDVVVTGFVFVGEHRAILCSGRDHDDPPFCAGTTIDLENLDPRRLDLVVPDGAPAYSRDEVTLAGTYSPVTLTVQDIL